MAAAPMESTAKLLWSVALSRVIRPSLPQILSIAVQMMMEIISISIIAKISSGALAAVGYCAGFVVLTYGVSIATSSATSAFLSPYVGAKKPEMVRRLGIRLAGFVFLSPIIIVVPILAIKPLIAQVFEVGPSEWADFATILAYSVGVLPFMCVTFLGFGLLRARGQFSYFGYANVAITSLQPAALLLVLTLPDGWVMQYGGHLVGFAHILPFLTGTLLALWLLLRSAIDEPNEPTLVSSSYRETVEGYLKYFWPIVAIGLMSPAVLMVMNVLIVKEGADAASGYAVISKLHPALQIFTLGIVGTVTSVIGQSLGARRPREVIHTYHAAILVLSLWHLMLGVVLYLTSTELARILSNGKGEQLVIWYLQIVPLPYTLWALTSVLVAAANTLSWGAFAFRSSILRNFLAIVPAMFIGFSLDGARGVLLGLGAGNIVAGLAILISFERIVGQATRTAQKKVHRRLKQQA